MAHGLALYSSLLCCLHSLAAAGWGWGGRMKFAVMHGCIPVIVQVGGLDVLGAGDLGAAN